MGLLNNNEVDGYFIPQEVYDVWGVTCEMGVTEEILKTYENYSSNIFNVNTLRMLENDLTRMLNRLFPNKFMVDVNNEVYYLTKLKCVVQDDGILIKPDFEKI